MSFVVKYVLKRGYVFQSKSVPVDMVPFKQGPDSDLSELPPSATTLKNVSY
jgi:hypothetical protein